MLKAQKLDPSLIREIQGRKLSQLVSLAYAHVPFYRRHFQQVGLTPAEISGIDDLKKIPIVSKTGMREVDTISLLDQRVDRDSLIVERSSGSTGTPFDVYYDSAFQSIRNLMFLRGLYAVGFRFGHQLLLISSRKPEKLSHRLLRWHYASIQDSGEILWRAFNKISPHFLYGCLTPLRALAEQVLERGKSHKLQGVITTAETLDENSRQLLGAAFGCKVFDFYGMSEMGLVGWECTAHQGYHLSEDMVVVEAIPSDLGGGTQRLVMTNLESRAMPFLRFDTGDLAELASNGPCKCGNQFSLMNRIEGREVDFIILPDGCRISPYEFTCAMEKVSEIERYQIIQKSYDALTVRVQPTIWEGGCPDQAIRTVIETVVGSKIKVDVESVDKLHPDPGRKFRVVECQL